MGQKILVADSDSAVQQVTTYFLQLEGFNVEAVGDGVSAMEAVEKNTPDVILLAPGLPGINGIEVSQLVREKPQYRNIPVLFLAESDEPLLNNMPDLSDKFGIVNKPIDPTKLVSTIQEYIGKGAKATEDIKESLKSIEELLGWDVSAGKGETIQKEEVPKEDIPHVKSFDVTDILSGIIKEPEKEKSPVDLGEALTVEKESEIISKKLDESLQPVTEEKSAIEYERKFIDDIVLSSEGWAQPAVSEDSHGQGESPENVEKDLKSRITDEMIENMVRKIAVDIVERVTREIVPYIAEREIIKEIERLKSTE